LPDLRRTFLLAVNEGIFTSVGLSRDVVEKWLKWKEIDENDEKVERLQVDEVRAMLVECCKDMQSPQ